jgi:hypothetical protein
MKYLLILCSVFIFASCGSTKSIKDIGSVEDIATAKLISSYYNNSFDFNTLAARMKVRYKDKKNSQSVTVSLRMDKGKTIWMSASILGISLAKARVTPTSVSYYEKIGRTYFDGDFDFLSEYFGVKMDFEQLERLLVGETVYDLREGKYVIDQVDNQYQITPKNQLDILNLFFFLEPQNFTLKKQRVTQPKDNLSLNVDYREHQILDGLNFPKTIFIEVLENTDRTTIDLDYKSVERNVDLRFPFTIPDGYKEIKF